MMINNTTIAKSRLVLLLLTLTIFPIFIFFLSNVQEIKIYNNFHPSTSLLELNHKTPGEYVKFLLPSEESYCKLNYGLPNKLTYTANDLEGTPELEMGSPFRVLYNVIEGHLTAHEPKVTYVTHLSKDFVNYLTEVIRFWEGSISVAVYVKNGDPTFILDRILHFCYCIPGMSRVSLHLVFPKDLHLTYHFSQQISLSTCNIPNNDKFITFDKNATDTSGGSVNTALNWYPINVCRNAARDAAKTDYVLVCDIELMPSQGLASRFIKMMDKETNPGNVIQPLTEAKREKPYTGWEPIYIGTKEEPMYYEKLSWEGFLDKMLQMMEMCLAGYRFVILDGAFLVHWPGIKRTTRADEPWRNPYIEINKEIYNDILMNVVAKKYPENKNCNAREL